MKKLFTLAAAATLATAALQAQAQVTLDGQIQATEIGAANTGKYVLAGTYTQAHGYGNNGFTKLYIANTDTKVYMFLQGTVESSGNAFQIYLDLPGVTGIAKGTALPGGMTGSGTSFEKMKAKLDMQADIAIGIQGNPTAAKVNAISYIGTVADKQVTPNLPPAGTAVTLDVASLGTITQLVGARVSYKPSADGKLTDAGTVGLEIELDRTALGIPNTGTTATATINLFAIQTNGGGDYLSSDMIPEITGNNGANPNESATTDFTVKAGEQTLAYTLVAPAAAQAAIALDGVLSSSDLAAGNYVLLGKYTNPRGFGDAGLLSLYAASTATKVYYFVAGTVQTNNNAFQLFLDLPAAGGVPMGTMLPAGAAGTSFEKMLAKLDLPVNLALALRGDATGFRIEAASYTNATTVVSKAVTSETTPFAGDGSAQTIATDVAFPSLVGARVAYKNATDGKVSANPGNITPNTAANYGGVGSFGWEIELDRAALGALAANSVLTAFALQNSGSGDFLSSDYIPQATTIPAGNGNVGSADKADFATVPGRQAAGITLTATGVALGSKSSREAATALRYSAYPNPGSMITVNYTVPQGKQDVNLSVFDATGRQVRSLRESQAGAQSYNLSNLRAGIYIVKLSVGGQQTSGKVVIE